MITLAITFCDTKNRFHSLYYQCRIFTWCMEVLKSFWAPNTSMVHGSTVKLLVPYLLDLLFQFHSWASYSNDLVNTRYHKHHLTPFSHQHLKPLTLKIFWYTYHLIFFAEHILHCKDQIRISARKTRKFDDSINMQID